MGMKRFIFKFIDAIMGANDHTYAYDLIGDLLAADLDGEGVFYSYDTNSNVTDLVDTKGDSVALYEYGPFGETAAQKGSLVEVNPFHFSTKDLDVRVGLYFYGYRFYQPELGRWISRDPIGDAAFYDRYAQGRSRAEKDSLSNMALGPSYLFNANNSLSNVDPHGLHFFGTYGNYCGPGWCGGKSQSEKDCACSKDPLPDPVNSIDSCCKNHDTCLGKGGGKECDDAMCDCLKGIDPLEPDPPPGMGHDQQYKAWRNMLGLFCSLTIPTH